ncbi:MAG: GNAT family N-acetyltransferase [Thermofilaceae archaeon]|nr:GNAT family N-acetyltransferase [Armatimonadota bacterium]
MRDLRRMVEIPQKTAVSVEAIRYQPEYRDMWDTFISMSKNGTFLFYRDYMEYHADRFIDHSICFFCDRDPIAVMPANEEGDVLISHAGLTFGGIISDMRMGTALMLEIFSSLRRYMRNKGFRKLIYKAVPHIYHRVPSEEDLYALFYHGARLTRRDVSSAIYLQEEVHLAKGRRYCLKKAKKHGVYVERSWDFHTFMEIEENLLKEKYGTSPTHTADEILLLARRFPENIKLFGAYRGGRMVGGVIVYESAVVAHLQYIATTEEGRTVGALEAIVGFLIESYRGKTRYLDFGISTEDGGWYLNTGLVWNKESYGARSVVHDFYEWDVSR